MDMITTRTILIHRNSQKGAILERMQNHPNDEVDPVDFVNPSIFSSKPLIGYSASSRLTELKNLLFLKISGYKGGIKSYFFKSKERQLYKITDEGMEYEFAD